MNIETNSAFDDAASAAVRAEIQKANTAPGIDFGPMMVQVDKKNSGRFRSIWTSALTHLQIPPNATFFQCQSSKVPGAYRPLGDIMTTALPFANGKTDGQVAPPGTLLFAPNTSDPTVLAQPTGFSWIADDKHSENPNNIAYFVPVAPTGYVAMGLCWGQNGSHPDPTAYWCVRADLVRLVDRQLTWSSAKQYWTSHSGSLYSSVMTATAQSGLDHAEMLVIPQTFLPDPEDGSIPNYALLLKQPAVTLELDAQLPDPNTPEPTGTKLNAGVSAVAVVPWMAVANDSSFPDRPDNSPFYFVVAEPYWQSIENIPSPAGGSYDIRRMLGTSESNSQTFSQSTSMEISADFGLEFEGLSASVSTKYTETFSMETQTTAGVDTEVEVITTITLPSAQQIGFWQLMLQVAVFRGDGSKMQTPYGFRDIRMSIQA
ncbi:hypothetical protein CJ178_30430 [Rhodococcus sp. ACPA4]|uniref:Vps62-related protein n=1 Tax=Rhodococcus sp. ACPA4 TaxID=2028571 RepID=UPI000BB0CDBB|nr:Vps62-related protein [Rhodococcus sp. ACPA4]PBC35784.1 hypothetical protein CJ178_30430 [Rhodococcus sp. ACPA4]